MKQLKCITLLYKIRNLNAAVSQVRQLVEIINAGTQAIQNLCVMNAAREKPEERAEWSRRWIARGLAAFEKLLPECSGKYCVGDEITLADCTLIPQLYNAYRFKVDMDQYPNIKRIAETCEGHEAFMAAHPDAQPDKA